MTCTTHVIPPVFYIVGARNVLIEVKHSSPAGVNTSASYHDCHNWNFAGDIRSIRPWGVFPDTNSIGLDCVDRAKNYCAGDATFDKDQCSLINIKGSFASGGPLVKKVQFDCDTVTLNNDMTDDEFSYDVGVRDPVGEASHYWIVILVGVLVFLLLAGIVACNMIRRRRLTSEESDEVSVDEDSGQETRTTSEGVSTERLTSKEEESDKESDKQGKKNKDGANPFKKVSTLVQGTSPRRPRSEKEKRDRELEERAKRKRTRDIVLGISE